MFDIGWSEILVIAVVAIVVVGPKDLPPMLRAFGRTIAKMRKMAGEFQGQFNEALKEAELDDVKKSFDELRGLNPLNDIRRSLDPMSGPIAKATPAPVPPAVDQLAQPATPLDLEPAPIPPVIESVKPKRARASKTIAEKQAVIAEEEGEVVPAIVRKPRAAKPKTRTADHATSAEIEPVVASKPRVRKPKSRAPSQDQTIEPITGMPIEREHPVEGPVLLANPSDETTP